MATFSFIRTAIEDFAFANRAYILATVTFYAPDANGDPTTTRITLYSDVTGSDALPNPQQLDDEGKFEQPVYFQDAWIAEVNLGPTSHRTGVVQPPLSDSGSVQALADAAAASADLAASYMVLAQQAQAQQLLAQGIVNLYAQSQFT